MKFENMNYQNKFNQGMTYAEYHTYTENKVENKSTSGVNQTEDLINYTICFVIIYIYYYSVVS